MYNNIYSPIFEKKEILDASERYALALSETMREGGQSYHSTKKYTHTAMLKKRI